MTEREEFDALVSQYKECRAASEEGNACACMGGCLGNHLAILRRKYDANYTGEGHWWSDQLHGALLIRPGDSGRTGSPLTASNYWTGAL